MWANQRRVFVYQRQQRRRFNSYQGHAERYPLVKQLNIAVSNFLRVSQESPRYGAAAAFQMLRYLNAIAKPLQQLDGGNPYVSVDIVRKLVAK